MMYLDVRTADEFATGHVPGAINIDVQDLMSGTLPDSSLDTPITVYCRSGARAGVAKNILEQAGFTHVTNAGGLSDVMK
jgi:rhodanese-related sulfurtransferase